MLHFIYDGSFEGLMQCVFTAYTQKLQPEGIHPISREFQPGLMETVQEVETCQEESERVISGVRETLGTETLCTVMNAFLRDETPMEMPLLHYLRVGFHSKRQLKNVNLECVQTITDAVLRIGREAHKYKSFVRFERLKDDIWYARISPQNNVLPLLASHFVTRQPDVCWIIHDLTRQLALVYDGSTARIHSVHDYNIPERHEEEELFQHLWRGFFDSVSIKERENYVCQRNHIPLLYRQYLTEFH